MATFPLYKPGVSPNAEWNKLISVDPIGMPQGDSLYYLFMTGTGCPDKEYATNIVITCGF
jgi:hypothetical protein